MGAPGSMVLVDPAMIHSQLAQLFLVPIDVFMSLLLLFHSGIIEYADRHSAAQWAFLPAGCVFLGNAPLCPWEASISTLLTDRLALPLFLGCAR